MSKLEIGTPLNTIKEELLTFATLLRAKGNQQFMTERTRKETIFRFAQRCKDWAGKLSDIDFQVGVQESDVIIYGVKAKPVIKLQIGESLLITNTGDEVKLSHIIHEDDENIEASDVGEVQEMPDVINGEDTFNETLVEGIADGTLDRWDENGFDRLGTTVAPPHTTEVDEEDDASAFGKRQAYDAGFRRSAAWGSGDISDMGSASYVMQRDQDLDSMESENLRSESTDDRVTGRGHF